VVVDVGQDGADVRLARDVRGEHGDLGTSAQIVQRRRFVRGVPAGENQVLGPGIHQGLRRL